MTVIAIASTWRLLHRRGWIADSDLDVVLFGVLADGCLAFSIALIMGAR